MPELPRREEVEPFGRHLPVVDVPLDGGERDAGRAEGEGLLAVAHLKGDDEAPGSPAATRTATPVSLGGGAVSVSCASMTVRRRSQSFGET